MRYFKTSKAESRDRKRRLAVAVITAIAGFASLPTPNCDAGHPSHGPIYRTLDALAGGIEKVIDVAGKASARGRSCDPAFGDDGCDAMTLYELEAASGHATPIYDDSSMQGSPYASQVESGPDSQISEPTTAPPLAQPRAQPRAQTTSPARKNPANSMPRSKPTPALQPMREPAKRPMLERAPQPMPAPLPHPMREPQPMPDIEPMREPMQPVDDGWFDSLSPQPITPTREQAIPEPRALRSPADTIDTLENPFKDDLQGRRRLKSANQPASYWQPW